MNRINWTELKPQIQQVGRLSLPAILTQITTIAMQYIDSAMVGALGANASAAIGLVSSTTWLLSGTIYAVSAGFSVQVAHQIGGNHDKKARDVVRHGIASALVVSAVLCLIGLLISHPLPGWLGGAAAVIGTGMIGFATAAWAKALGAETVFVIGRGEAKRAIAEQIPGISYVMEEESKAIQADVVVEAVGTPQAVSSAVLLARPGGSIVLMGNPSGDLAMEKNVYWRILRKQLNLMGTWNSSYEKDEACDWTEVLDALSKKKIPAQALITHCFPSEKLMDGLELMKNHKEPYCKVMVSWE